MSQNNTILEISVASEENGVARNKKLENINAPEKARAKAPWHTLFLSEENTLLLFVKNVSGAPLTFGSVHGVAATRGSNEPERSTTIYLDFGTLLNRSDLSNIAVNADGDWNSKVLIREKDKDNGKNFFYLGLTPAVTVTLKAGEILKFELKITPKGRVRLSYLSISVDNLITPDDRDKPGLDQTEFLLALRSTNFNNKLELVSGFKGEDILFVPTKKEITNVFTLFMMNAGPDISFGNLKKGAELGNIKLNANSNDSPHLKVKFSENIETKEATLNTMKLDTTGNFWKVELKNSWKSGEAIEFNLTLKTSKKEKEGIGNLRIEYFNIPHYQNGLIFFPIKKMEKKLIGNTKYAITISANGISEGKMS